MAMTMWWWPPYYLFGIPAEISRPTTKRVFRSGIAARWGSSTALLCAVATACAARPPDLVLVVVDTLRADHLGVYGYSRPTSPTIDALARGGTFFRNAASPASWTKPAVASLFTSRLPSEHGAVSFERDLDQQLPLLADALRARGYYTAGVSGNFVHVSATHGFGRGFDFFESPNIEADGEGSHILELATGAGPPRRYRALRARELNHIVAQVVRDRPAKPLFLYVHYMEPHAGYEPPPRLAKSFLRDPAFASTAPEAGAAYVSGLAKAGTTADPREVSRLIDLYDAEIASVDEAIAELRKILDAAGLSRALWLLTADHGEEFAEHGSFFHGIRLYDETVRVPLVISGPGVEAKARDEAVDLLDVAPTLLARAGAPPLRGARGRDLLAREVGPRDLIAELHADRVAEAHLGPRRHWFSVTRWPYRLVAGSDGSRELYRKDRDPGEKAPLGKPDAALTGALDDIGASAWRAPGESGGVIEPATRDALRALGYAD
jgi:arylsulfatase A-like enzyme